MMYPFSLGDLRDSTIVLSNYMENAPSKIPWADLRYVKKHTYRRRDVERIGENRRGKGRRGERRREEEKGETRRGGPYSVILCVVVLRAVYVDRVLCYSCTY